MMTLARLLCGLWIALATAGGVSAHALEPGYLDLRQISPEAWQVFWRKPDVRGKPMAITAQLPETCTPDRGPEPGFDGAAWIAGWISDCPNGLAGQDITIGGLERQNTDVLVRVQPLDGQASTFRLTPDETVVTLPVDPGTGAVFASYLKLGFEHILEGWDHLLFVFALLILIADIRRLVGAITAFTLAHSITLALAALDIARVPGPPVEAAIALSIVFLAVEIIRHRDGKPRLSVQNPWIVSFSFGLLHGLGFAGALKEIGLPQGDIPAALLAFNVGVELGQLAFVFGVLLAAAALRVIVPKAAAALREPGLPQVVTGYAIGGVATFWLAERVAGF